MKILVTAGPTREPIDPVRFISNRSSGKMGYAIAWAAVKQGHDVTLISGPVALIAPAEAVLVQIETAAQMHEAVHQYIDGCDVLIMAAAVADWRPKQVAPRKIKKVSAPPVLEMERTIDILDSVKDRKGKRVFVGFAAETHDVLNEAHRKLKDKKLDLICANDVTRTDAGFEVDTNKVTMIADDGEVIDLPVMKKHQVADKLLHWVENRMQRKA